MKHKSNKISEYCDSTAVQVITSVGLDLFLSTSKHRIALLLVLVQVSRVYFESITGSYLV